MAVGRFRVGDLDLLLSVAIDKLDTDLLGEGQLDLLAGRGSQFGDTLLNRLSGVGHFWNGNALVLDLVLTADTGQVDWLVDAGLDWLWVGHSDGDVDGGHDRDIVLGGLGHFVAVLVVAVSAMPITAMASIGWGTNGDHLDLGLLLETDLNGGSSGILILSFVVIAAHLVWNLLDGLSADSAGDIIAELPVHDYFDGQVDIVTDSLKGWGADLSNFSHVLHCAVLLGLLVAISSVWCRSRVSVRWWGRVAISWGGVAVGRSGVAGQTTDQGHQGKDGSENLWVGNKNKRVTGCVG